MSELDRVMPIPGARVVSFDWLAAEDAIAMVNRTMTTIVGDQVDGRQQAGRTAAEDWSGHFRDEFDRAEGLLLNRFGSISWAAMVTAGQIRGAADAANERQREYNAQRREQVEAEEAAAAAEANEGPVPIGAS